MNSETIEIVCDQTQMPDEKGWYFLSIEIDGVERQLPALVDEHVSGLCVTINAGRTWQPLAKQMMAGLGEHHWSRRLSITAPATGGGDE